jgi:single-stranded DNA-binding protein
MSASVLIKGVVFKAPEQRMSKAGNAFTMATVRVPAGEAAQFWRVFAFGDHARADLDLLGDGDHVAIQGLMTAEIYQAAQGPRVSLAVTADHVLAQRQPPKERARKSKASPQPSRRESAGRGRADPDDSIPF